MGALERLAAGVLVDGDQARHAVPGLVLAAHQRAGALGRDEDHVEARVRRDLLEVHVQAVREQQRAARAQLLSDRLHVDLGLLHVGREQRDEVGLGSGGGALGDAQPVSLGLVPARPALARADHDVEAGVAQVQRVGAALAAVADDGDSLPLEGVGFLGGHGEFSCGGVGRSVGGAVQRAALIAP